MAIDNEAVGNLEQAKNGISSLSEFGEYPKGYISVFLVVTQEDLSSIEKNGILPYIPVNNDQRNFDNEIDQLLKDKKVPIQRKGSFFAYSENPNSSHMSFRVLDIKRGDVILEVKVDPKKCFVAFAESYDKPKKYVESIVPYDTFINREDYMNNGFWEVIIPIEMGSIPTGHIKAVELIDRIKLWE